MPATLCRAAFLLPAVLLLPLLPALGGCAPQRRHAGEPRETGPSVTVATFNLYHPAHTDPDTVEAIERTGADVVFLQEVTPAWQAVLEQRYDSRYPHRFFAAAGGAGGLGVLSRYPLADTRVLPAPVKHPAALVRVDAPPGAFRALNVHLRSVFTRRGDTFIGAWFSAGADHVHELERFASALSSASPPLPALVVGDFNESSAGAAIQWLEQRGYTNALPRHWHSQYTFRALGGALRLALDHILYDPAFESLDAWVARHGNSDHFPVIARLRMPLRPAPPEPPAP